MGKNSYSAAEIDVLIGERVRSRRLQAKVSQAVLGEALGITLQQIQKYETGANRIGCGRLLKIAEVLDCDVAEFYESINDGRSAASTPFSRFMATKDGVAIIEAMLKIENQDLRRMVIEIAEKFAEAQFVQAKPVRVRLVSDGPMLDRRAGAEIDTRARPPHRRG
jgi:transcriptional regulator with XRE-family HTH domain